MTECVVAFSVFYKNKIVYEFTWSQHREGRELGQAFIYNVTSCLNKSSLLLKIQNQNTHTLQLLAEKIETEIIYKSN